MTPVGPILAPQQARWHIRLHDFTDTYHERQLQTAPRGNGSDSISDPLKTFPVEPTRGRIIDLSV